MSTPSGYSERDFMADLGERLREREAEGEPLIAGFTVVDEPPEGADGFGDEEATTAEASRLLEPIVTELAALGPARWQRFEAVFAFTVTAEVAQLRFFVDEQSGLVPVPKAIAAVVRQQRLVAAEMPAGPWWRLLLSVTEGGEMTVDYDYGDDPFPDDQILAPEDYLADLDTFPRNWVPVWLAGYIAGPDAQGRSPRRAAAQASADRAVGRGSVTSQDVAPLTEVWARWAALSAVHVGVGSEWGPRIKPGYGWFEGNERSGSTLYVLPGDRAVLSGGRWGSALLDAAYNGGEDLPALYAGAPAWVTDGVLNTRNRNGLLSFCYWWMGGQWHRGGTDTHDELVALPAVGTADETVDAMVAETGAQTAAQCRALLAAAAERSTTYDAVAAVFAEHPDADIDAAVNQLDVAGLMAR
ncbi:hypothetical protein H7I41_00540 [Mycobacterium manitobense]|uniref:Uncharacterized protein n=1 Tax=[Mycobacterium] manitobense TaxID=190147 RepID=A0A9X2YJ43_9MYCO|nr:hypothetical protein [[Mycobacterium] manitobense]MCV7168400.1 hypothetical protein [[Mycobacterium] manitobense]